VAERPAQQKVDAGEGRGDRGGDGGGSAHGRQPIRRARRAPLRRNRADGR
jgi:hypothetical protein